MDKNIFTPKQIPSVSASFASNKPSQLIQQAEFADPFSQHKQKQSNQQKLAHNSRRGISDVIYGGSTQNSFRLFEIYRRRG